MLKNNIMNKMMRKKNYKKISLNIYLKLKFLIFIEKIFLLKFI